MSNSGFIQDGTGGGYLAQVDNQNRLVTTGITEPVFDAASFEGVSFNLNTEDVSVAVVAPQTTPLLYFKNNEQRDIALVGWFIAIDNRVTVASPYPFPLFRVFGNPTLVTPDTAVAAVNRRIGDPRSFNFLAYKQAGLLNFTTSGSPVLYQYQRVADRVFGNVNLTVGAGQSVGVTAEFLAGFPAVTLNLYTGFSGYIGGVV